MDSPPFLPAAGPGAMVSVWELMHSSQVMPPILELFWPSWLLSVQQTFRENFATHNRRYKDREGRSSPLLLGSGGGTEANKSWKQSYQNQRSQKSPYIDRSKVDRKPTKELSLPGRFGEDPNPQFKGLVPFILMKDPKWKPRTCPFTEDMKHPIAIFPVMAKLTSRKMVSQVVQQHLGTHWKPVLLRGDVLKPGLTLQFCFLTLWPIVVSGNTLRETHWGGKKLISIQLPWAAWSLTRADGSLLGTLPHDFQEAEGSGLHLPLITVVSDVLYSKWCTLSRQGRKC